MIKDYAKQTQKHTAKKKQNVLWVSLLVTIAILLSLFCYFHFQDTKHQQTRHENKTMSTSTKLNFKKNNTSPTVNTLKKANPKIQFDFYTLLPKMQVNKSTRSSHKS